MELTGMMKPFGNKNDKENKTENQATRSAGRCVALIEHNLRKISSQLWEMFLLATNRGGQSNFSQLDS